MMKARKLVLGVGINNASYAVSTNASGGDRVLCPFYSAWSSMYFRCYSTKYHEIRPTYTECTVDKEWLKFTDFKDWMLRQDWEGKCLDKDILAPNNKIYSSKTCVFVTEEVNNLLIKSSRSRGKCPLGVSYHKFSKRYRAQCSANNKINYLGSFKSVDEAELAYKTFKSNHIKQVAETQEPRIKKALIIHAELYLT